MPSERARASGSSPSWRWSILVAAVSIAAFVPALRAGFVLWDDPENFTYNPDFGGLSLAGLRWAWTSYTIGVYQPLGWMLLEAEHSLWGLHPMGYHAVSLVLHGANAVALFALSQALLRRAAPHAWVSDRERRTWNGASAFAAAAFAVHPLRTEAVAWISCQTYLPAVCLAMLAVLAYLHAHPDDGPARAHWVVAAWLLAVAAMLCKAVAVTLPLVLIILDVYPLGRIGPGRWHDGRTWREKLVFLAPALVFMVIAFRAKAAFDVVVPVSHFGIDARLAQSFYGVGFYLAKTFWPVRLSAYYPLPERVDLRESPFAIAALSVLAITAAALLVRKRWPGFLAAWLAYLVILSPNLGLVRIGSYIAADRYAYMASIPLTVALAWAVARLFRVARPHRVLCGMGAIGAVVCLTALAARSWEQSRTWQTSQALWTSALAVSDGRNALILGNLGEALMDAGQIEEAAATFRDVLRLSPQHAQAHYDLGLYSVWHERLDEAEHHFRAAIRKIPRRSRVLADTHYNLGCVLEQKGQLEAALAEYQEAVRLNPRNAAFHNNFGAVRLRQGRYREAEACFEQALRLDPHYARARRGRDYARQMQPEVPASKL